MEASIFIELNAFITTMLSKSLSALNTRSFFFVIGTTANPSLSITSGIFASAAPLQKDVTPGMVSVLYPILKISMLICM